MNENPNDFIFANEDKSAPAPPNDEASEIKPWKVLIVDDDVEVHAITKLVLKGFSFAGRALQLISAHNANDAIALMQEHTDIAAVLLDIIMDTDHCGFDVVRAIRDDLKNNQVRIVLRTGQPGQAPEEEIIEKYDIHDYKDKTELTSQKLITLIYSTLRAYNDIHQIFVKKQELEAYYVATLEQLKKSKKHIFNIIDSMPSVLIGINSKFEVTDWNHKAQTLSAISSKEATGKNIFTILRYLTPYKTLIEKTLLEQTEYKEERILLTINKKQHHFDITVYPITIGSDAGAVIRIDDITDRIKVDNIMVQSEKMVTIGGLATGMAHEIKNPLGIIVQHVQNIINRVDINAKKNIALAEKVGIDIEKLHDYLEQREILKFIDSMRIAVDDALRIIANMLGFGSSNDTDMVMMDLRLLIKEAISFIAKDFQLQHTFRFTEDMIQCDFPSDLPPIPCSKTPLVQVFINLLKNSVQAMSDNTDHPKIIVSAAIENNYIKVTIADNGTGMTADTVSKLFKPFYTNKRTNNRAGLGLSVCQYIITEVHAGDIAVADSSAQGTTFIIYLPTRHRKHFYCPKDDNNDSFSDTC